MSQGLTAEIARDLLTYDPETGVFMRRRSPRPWTLNKPLGCLNPKGYSRFYVHDGPYVAHRVAWLYVYGRWPKEQVDHINHVRHDNRIANLRECTNAENRQNIIPQGYGSSGYLGVHANRAHGLWDARITLHGKTTELGTFSDKEEAYKVYMQAKMQMHSFFAKGAVETAAV